MNTLIIHWKATYPDGRFVTGASWSQQEFEEDIKAYPDTIITTWR